MTYDVRAIANFILDQGEVDAVPISNLSLNKILYFLHGHYLATTGQPLVDEPFEAWEYGPVQREVYAQFRTFDDRPITSRAMAIDFTTGHKSVVSQAIDSAHLDLLISVSRFYSRMPAGKLVEISHSAGGPWDKTWNHDKVSNPGMLISNQLIRDYFRSARIGRLLAQS